MIYKIFSYLNIATWITLGVLTLGSIFYGTMGISINITVGIIFLLIGFYFYKRMVVIVELLKSRTEKTYFKKFITYETILIVFSTLMGLILNSAAVSRVFFENTPIFG